MTNLFTCLSKKSLSLENGSGMHRDCIGDESAISKKLFASVLFLLLLFGVGQMWGVEIYSNAGATGTSGGVTASGNVNTNSANGNPGNSFANTTSDNATFTFTGFSVSGYGALKLSIDAAFKSFPNTTNTWPYATVTFKKNNVAVKTDNTTIKWSSKDNSYSTYTIDNIPDFDKIEIVGSPAIGKTKKGDDATNYAIYMDNITLTGCPNPTSLTTGTITSSTAQLSWSDASDVGSYEVFRSTSSSTPAANETPTATVTSKSVTFESLTASTTYYWWVRTKCSNSEKSAWVAGTSFTTSAGAVCADPNAPGNSSVSGTGVTISTTSAAANYDIYLSTSSTTPTTQDPTASTSSANSKAISDLSYGTTYYYWMRQNCGSSTSSWVAGSPTSFTTTIPAPTGLSMTPSLNGVTFSITDANDVNNYEIYYSTTNSEPGASPSGTATTTSKSKAVTGLPASTTYYCWVRAKGPNANSSWYSAGSFATLTLSSISVSTAPTKTKYLVGDNFDPTGLVITRTYSNSTSDTYTYAGHTGDFSFSPATNAALTALNTSVTITYGGQTTSQAINVYSVTVNKVNMSSVAIADAGVSASCSGRTLSQSVGSTNYKFNTYAVTAGGVGISGSSITGTPTGNVTINAKFHDPITVTWKVGNGAASGSPTGEVKYGTAITALPSTPADNALSSCGTNKFMGWSASELTGTGNDAPADLFTTVGGAANLTTNTTYRAVFASSTSGAAANTVLFEEPFTGMTADTKPTSPGASATIYGGATITYTFSDGTGTSSGTTAIKNEALTYSGSAPEVLVGKKGTSTGAAGGTVVITGIPNGGASALTVSYTQNANGLSATASGTGYSGSTSGSSKTDKSFDVTVSSNADPTLTLTFQATSTSNVRLDDIKVKVKTAGTTYADYQTGCCSAPGTALSITSANSKVTGGTVSLTSTGGNGGTVTWSVVNGTGSATISDGVLTAGSVGTVTVKAHQNANTVLGVEYCAQDAEQAFTVVSSTVNVTGVEVSPTTKAIVPGETFTITATVAPADATDKSVSWTSSASDKASVSSGTVTGVAAGSATITCTTTDGSYTDETAVTVYAVTMQALDEDGNAIAVGGPGTPSRTGASISPAADAGNYVFKEWAISGASLGSSASTKANTITNPTGAVTVTAKYYKPRVVKWSVNGDNTYDEGSPTLTVAYNSAISAVPDAPADNTLNNCANKFMGWSTKSWGSTTGKDDSDYDDLFTTADGYTTGITDATKTFYAVFAERDGAAENTVIWSEDWTGATTASAASDDAKPSAQGDHSGKTAYGGASIKYEETTSGTYVRNENNAGGSKPELMVKASEVWTVSGIPNGGASKLTVSYKQNGQSLTVAASGTSYSGSNSSSSSGAQSFDVTVGSTSTFTLTFTAGSSNVRVDNIEVKVKTPIYSNYVTQCAANQVRVTYDFNGGTGTACTQGVTTTNANYTVCSTEPTKTGYDFNKWSDGTNTYAAGATGYNLASSTTFTAQWKAKTYTITYKDQGGSAYSGTNGASLPGTHTYGSATALVNGAKGNGYRFDGWYPTSACTGAPITSFAGDAVLKDTTLYAKWTVRHEIVFDVYGGSTTTIYRASDENIADAVGVGSKPSDPDAPSTCSSKTFVGWVESEIDDETDTKPGTLTNATGKVTEDKHYYATWALKSGTDIDAVEDNSFSSKDENGSYGSSTFSFKAANKYLQQQSIWDSDDMTTGTKVKIRVYHFSNSTTDVLRISLINSSGTEVTGADLNTSKFGSNISSGGWSDYVELTPTTAVTGYKVSMKTLNSNGTGINKIEREVVASYSKYATSCCATKVTLSQNSPSNGTIVFGKSTQQTCDGDKEVSLTITPAAGYQLHSYEVATGSGKVAAKSVSPDIALDNNSSAAQNITLTFAEDANGAYDVTASFSEMTVTSWTWTNHDGGAAVTTDPFEIYVGQSAQVDVAYNPSSVLSSHKNYSRSKDDTYINWPAGAQPSAYCTFIGKATTGENTTTITLTHSDAALEQLVYVKVLPLPLVHFKDNVHGVEFDDVVATLTANALTNGGVDNTPTHDDFDGSTANTCEEQHLHLVGWIDGAWPAYAAYMAGTGDKPSESAIVGATGYFYLPGAEIDLVAKDGHTYYAIWAKVE